MNTVELVKLLCRERKISIHRLESDLGFSNGYIGQLRKGMFPADRLAKIADYFGVTTDYLLGAETEKAPAESGERDIKAAFFDGMGLTEDEQNDLWQDAKEYFQFKIAQRKRKDGNR